MLAGLLLFTLVATSAPSQASGTDLSFVSCWPKQNSSPPLSRSVKSVIVTSSAHWRAYATVTTQLENGSCRNTSKLYVASPEHNFVLVFSQSAEKTQDGNGVRIVGWSPDGEKLMTEITTWAYGSDAGVNRAALVYDIRKAVQKPDIGKSVQERFGTECLFDYSIVSWWWESNILLRIRPFREELENRPSCLNQPLLFVYEINTGVLKPLKARSMARF